MLGSGGSRRLPLGRFAAVPSCQSELVLGLLYAGLSRWPAGGLRRATPGCACAQAGGLYAIARLSPRCAPPCRRDERRSRSRAPRHVPLGLAERLAGPALGNDRRPISSDIQRG